MRLRAPLALAALALIAAGCGRRVALGGSRVDGEVPPAPDPCEGQPCGAPCPLSPCEATPDQGCTSPEAMGFCDPQGQCSLSFPQCGAFCEGQPCGAPCSPCADGTPGCPPGACDGFGQCMEIVAPCPCGPEDCPPPLCVGEPCSAPCDPCQGDPNCPSPGPSVCDGFGTCVPADGFTCAQPEPCAGLLCAASCDPCAGVPGCEPPPFPFRCDESAACLPAEMVVCPSGYVPCNAKVCGDPCSICEPGYPCEPQPPSTCDLSGQCVPGSVVCE